LCGCGRHGERDRDRDQTIELRYASLSSLAVIFLTMGLAELTERPALIVVAVLNCVVTFAIVAVAP